MDTCRVSTILRSDKQVCGYCGQICHRGELAKISRWFIILAKQECISFTIRRVMCAPHASRYRRSRRHHHDIKFKVFGGNTQISRRAYHLGRGHIRRAYHRPRSWRVAARGRDRETSMHQMRVRLRATSVEGAFQDTGRYTRTFT